MSKVNDRIKALEALKDVTPKADKEMIKVLEQMFAMNPKNADEERELLATLKCNDKTRELILFAINVVENEYKN